MASSQSGPRSRPGDSSKTSWRTVRSDGVEEAGSSAVEKRVKRTGGKTVTNWGRG